MQTHLIPARQSLPGNDPIFTLNAEAQTRAAAGEDILNLTLGALADDHGNLVVLDSVMALWRELSPREVAPYPPIAGDPAYLDALVQRHWPNLEGSGVACATPGGSGALMLSAHNFLEPGMAVLTAAPYWGPYGLLSSERGVTLRTAPFPRAGASLDLEAWRKAAEDLIASQGRLLIWLNEPCHNPTGWSLDPADRLALRELFRELGRKAPLTLILDCAYLDYTADPGHVRAGLDAWAELGNAEGVLLGASLSLSKALTLYGGRGGALAFPWSRDPALKAALACSCRGTWSCCAKAPQALLLRLAKDGKAQMRLAEEHRHWSEVLEARAAALQAAMTELDLTPLSWRGGFFVTLPELDSSTRAARLRDEGVFAVPLDGGLRLGLCALRQADAPRLARALRKTQ